MVIKLTVDIQNQQSLGNQARPPHPLGHVSCVILTSLFHGSILTCGLENRVKLIECLLRAAPLAFINQGNCNVTFATLCLGKERQNLERQLT